MDSSALYMDKWRAVVHCYEGEVSETYTKGSDMFMCVTLVPFPWSARRSNYLVHNQCSQLYVVL